MQLVTVSSCPFTLHLLFCRFPGKGFLLLYSIPVVVFSFLKEPSTLAPKHCNDPLLNFFFYLTVSLGEGPLSCWIAENRLFFQLPKILQTQVCVVFARVRSWLLLSLLSTWTQSVSEELFPHPTILQLVLMTGAILSQV